jgi:DNA-binding MarR family transcriptional regulator
MHIRPPFKLSVAALLLDGTPRTLAQMLEDLAPIYADSRLLTPANMDSALQSLKCVGIVNVLDSENGGETLYSLTGYGRQRTARALPESCCSPE